MNTKSLPASIWQKSNVLKKFPFYIADTVGVNEYSRNLHWHNEMEICYIKEGTGKYLINGREYSYEAGDVFIINNDEIHVAFDDRNLIMQVTLFSKDLLWSGGTCVMDYEYLRPFIEAGKSFSNKLERNQEHIEKVIEILMKIQQEYKMMQEGYELMIKSLLLKLMTVIIRYFKMDTKPGVSKIINSQNVQKLKNAIEYIEQFYYKPLKIAELAGISKMSVSHFCFMFKTFAGITPMEYIIRMRVIVAKEVLKNTDKKILEVAMECGFNSLSNFNRCFKIYTGVSPRQYRVS